MKTKYLIIFLLFLFGNEIKANIASPIQGGTEGASPFINEYVDILKEQINIRLDESFSTAFYQIEYTIQVNKEGLQIPLLFHAMDYGDEFKIALDGQAIELINIPDNYLSDTTILDGLHYTLDDKQSVIIKWNEHSGIYDQLKNLKYFETDLSIGQHQLSIEYNGLVWIDQSDWVRAYSFQYSLSPAQHWKSFGELEINLDANAFSKNITTNLGAPTTGHEKEKATWKFNELPSDVLEINYTPSINKWAALLIFINPFGIALLLAALLVFLHFLGIRYYRKNSRSRFSWVAILGSFLVPFLAMLSYVNSHFWIDQAIGPQASQYHGYPFMIFIFYPIILIAYWIVAWQFDGFFKRKFNSMST